MNKHDNKKLAFVSGGNRGIGKACVLELAKRGFELAFSYHKNEQQALQLQNQLRDNQSNCLAVHMDNALIESIDDALLKIQSYFGKPVSVLVNNAAMIQECPFLDITQTQFNTMMQTNLYSAFYLTQKLLPAMLETERGKIVNISSIGGQWGGVNQVHYALAKSGLISLTKSIAKMYASSGIVCNAVAPGLIATDMIANEMKTEAGQKKLEAIPSQRLGTPEEIAKTVSFLVSDGASYINGQTINANGGMLFN